MGIKCIWFRLQIKINSSTSTSSYDGLRGKWPFFLFQVSSNSFLIFWHFWIIIFPLAHHPLVLFEEKLQHHCSHTNKSRHFVLSWLPCLWNSILLSFTLIVLSFKLFYSWRKGFGHILLLTLIPLTCVLFIINALVTNVYFLICIQI